MQSLLWTASQASTAASKDKAFASDPKAPPFCKDMKPASPVPFRFSKRTLVVNRAVVGLGVVVDVWVEDVLGGVVEIVVEVASSAVELLVVDEDTVDVDVVVEVKVVDVAVLSVVSSSDVVLLVEVAVVIASVSLVLAAALVLRSKVVDVVEDWTVADEVVDLLVSVVDFEVEEVGVAVCGAVVAVDRSVVLEVLAADVVSDS